MSESSTCELTLMLEYSWTFQHMKNIQNLTEKLKIERILQIHLFWVKYNNVQNKPSGVKHTYVQQNIFENTLIKVCCAHLYASFGTFCVQIGQLFEVQWDFKLSEEFEIDVIFLIKQRFYRFHAFFRDSLCLE